MSAAALWVVPLWLVGWAALAVPLARRWGARAGTPLALAVAALAVPVAVAAPLRHGSTVAWSTGWIPAIDATASLRLDALAQVFTLMVLLVGAAVLWYSPGYLSSGRYVRYYVAVLGFIAGMVTLVLAEDLLLFYVGWEATTLTSFLLIAHERTGRAAAVRALLMTFAGGLVLLGATLFAAATAGTLSISALARPGTWPDGSTVFLALLLVAAATKSAQMPFHAWLPAAMVAPTPVSAYLHGAAMVQAGVYLLLRFASVLADDPVVSTATVVIGGVTAVAAAVAALRRDDLKELLAYSTISQLGVMVALIGVGTATAVTGVILHVLAHASYKSALFLVAGTADHELGTRRLSELGGSVGRLPAIRLTVLMAASSMAGLPPLLGWVSKEEILKALIEEHTVGGWVTLGLVGTALAVTVAYAVRLAAPFLRRGGAGAHDHVPPRLATMPLLLAAAGLLFGLVAARLTAPIDHATRAVLGDAPAAGLGLWHGATPAFWSAVVITTSGLLLWWLQRRRPSRAAGTPVMDRLQRLPGAVGAAIARALDGGLRSPSPATHLGVLLAALATATVLGTALTGGDTIAVAGGSGPDWAVTGLLLATAVAAASARDRLAAVAVLAVLGFLVAAFYVLHGGADLAMTQLLVDALTVALIGFLFRDLPRTYPVVPPSTRVGALVLAGIVGVGLGGATYVSRAASPSPAARDYLARAPAEGADNVVNAVLTDFRALDTLLETTVLATAAIGVVVVLRSRWRTR